HRCIFHESDTPNFIQSHQRGVKSQPVRGVDDRMIDELVFRAQSEGLQPTGEGGLRHCHVVGGTIACGEGEVLAGCCSG
ncbi:hypothetical protein GTY86_24175, partial [Streptomyces sp. SID5770]|nr:hypothetical protein [Streptomyces sp. SID5770]